MAEVGVSEANNAESPSKDSTADVNFRCERELYER